MEKELQQNVFDALKQLAEKLGTTSERLYGVLVKQAKVDAIVSLIVIAALIPANYFSISFIFNHCGDSWFTYTFPDIGVKSMDAGGLFSVIIAVVLFIGSLIYSACAVHDIATGFLNPEYAATERVLSVLDKKS